MSKNIQTEIFILKQNFDERMENIQNLVELQEAPNHIISTQSEDENEENDEKEEETSFNQDLMEEINQSDTDHSTFEPRKDSTAL